MDNSTILGLVLGSLMLFLTVFVGNGMTGVLSFIDIPSIIVTFGGGMCAVMISLPGDFIKNAKRVTAKAFTFKAEDPKKLIEMIVHFAEVARRDGILALESSIKEIKDEFMVKGIQLAVDGTDPELIRETMQTELEMMAARHEDGKKFFDLMGKYCPAFGMIGTLIGLVLMLQNLEDPSTIGPSMAVAIITSFYGAAAANFVCLPLADKLAIRSAQESVTKEIIIRGVMAIQSGDNPRIVEQKLKIFLSPEERATFSIGGGEGEK